MEVMGFNFTNHYEEDFVRTIFDNLEVIYLNEKICNKVINIRKNFNIKLPDAIICASAIINNALLITNDEKLKLIEELKIKPVSLVEMKE